MQRRIGNSGKGLELKARAGQLAALVALGSFALLAPMAAQAQAATPAAAPASAPAPAAAPLPAPAPAATAAPAPAAATAAAATDDSPFQIPPGWRRKTVKGEEVFCKKTAVTGSRFGKEVCMTLAQLEQHERNNAEMRERMQQSFRLCSGGSPCAAN